MLKRQNTLTSLCKLMKCVNNSKLFNGPVRNRDFGEKIVFVPYISFVGCNLLVVDIYLLLTNSTDKLMKMNR